MPRAETGSATQGAARARGLGRMVLVARMDRQSRRRCKARGNSGSLNSAPECPLEIVLRVAMMAREVGTGQAENGLYLRGWCSSQQQFLGDPEVGDTPIGLGKTLGDAQAMQPGLIDGGGLVWCENGCRKYGWKPVVRSGNRQAHRKPNRRQPARRDAPLLPAMGRWKQGRQWHGEF